MHYRLVHRFFDGIHHYGDSIDGGLEIRFPHNRYFYRQRLSGNAVCAVSEKKAVELSFFSNQMSEDSLRRAQPSRKQRTERLLFLAVISSVFCHLTSAF
jgi:hypothetical protein